MKRVNFTYEMAAKICELIEEQGAGPSPPQGYTEATPELEQHEKTMDRLEKWAGQQMAKRLAKGYEPKED